MSKLNLVLKGLTSETLKQAEGGAELCSAFEAVVEADQDAAIGTKDAQNGAYVVSVDQQGKSTVYHRYLLNKDEGVDAKEIVEDINFNVLKRDKDYVSTRGSSSQANSTAPYRFLDVIREGLSSGDGGLFMPKQLPRLPKALLARLSSADCSTYVETAQLVLERLSDPAMLSPTELGEFLGKAYAPERWVSSKGVVCPVVALAGPSSPIYLLELFHGPTAAFKDFALQLFPYLFQKAISQAENRYVILAATSGDTGVAVIEGVRLSQAPNLKVMVLYPNHGVSPVQKIQMVGADGPAVRVVGVESDFDFCQSTVKHIFSDKETNADLKAKSKVILSSANSINWGRLVPQIVYYFFGYGELVRKHKLPHGSPIDVCVPTGNFGNILSCFVAKKMGLPVRRFVLASNENDVLYDFVRTGVYDIKTRNLVPTESPSIDILRASNIERLLYLLSNGDTGFVKTMMEGLNGPEKRFEVTEDMKKELQSTFWSMRCDRATCAKTIGEVYASTQQRPEGHYLLDPHTAVAVYAAQQYRDTVAKDGGVPILLASTAHWAKFPPAVMEALKIPVGHQEETSAENYQLADSVKQVKQWYSTICESSKASHVNGVSVEAAVPLADMINNGADNGGSGARVSAEDMAKLTAAVVEFSA